MLLYTSTSDIGLDPRGSSPVVVWDNLTYGNWKDEREADLVLEVPQSVRTVNGSWWMDVVLVKGGGSSVAGKGRGEVALYRKRAYHIIPIWMTR